MHISLNELTAALKKYFEAKQYFLGNIEDATNMIIWLERHGLNGLQEFEYSIPYLDLDGDKSFSSILYEDHSLAVIDCHNRSALNCISSAVDLAQVKALEGGIATVVLRRCHNRKFILKALADGGKRGMSFSAYWQNLDNPSFEYTASIQSGAELPSFSSAQIASEESVRDDQGLIISCSTHVDLRYDCKPREKTLKMQHFEPAYMREYSERTLENGIKINPELWLHINDVGKHILVKESLASQRGAGEAS